MALNPGPNQYTHPTYIAKVCFMAATVPGNITTSMGSGCGLVGRAVASDTRGTQFESSH